MNPPLKKKKTKGWFVVFVTAAPIFFDPVVNVYIEPRGARTVYLSFWG